MLRLFLHGDVSLMIHIQSDRPTNIHKCDAFDCP